MAETPSGMVNPYKCDSPIKVNYQSQQTMSRQPTHLEKGRLLVKLKLLTLNQPHLGNIDVSNQLIIHVNKGAALGLMVEDTEGRDKVDVLGAARNRGAGDDGRLRRHSETV